MQPLSRYVHPGDWMFTGKVESQGTGDDIFIDECTVLSITLKWSCVILNHLTRKISCGKFAELVLFVFCSVLCYFIFEKIEIILKVGTSDNIYWAFLHLLGVSANQVMILVYEVPLQDGYSELVWHLVLGITFYIAWRFCMHPSRNLTW